MMTLQPLASVAEARFRPAEHFGFAATLSWIPVNDTEFHLTAHHLPLTVRLLGGMPRLGAMVHPAFLARAAVDGEGRWRAGYRPLALRTYPFVLSNRQGARPIDVIDFVAEAGLVGPWGMPVCADPASGALSPEMEAVRNTLLMTRDGAVRLSAALDLLRISNVLVPLRDPENRAAADLVVDAARLAALDEGAVAALAGRSFLPLDLAGAILFSRSHLAPERLPRAEPGRAVAQPEPSAAPGSAADIVLSNLAAMNFALDGSDLFDLASVADWTEFAAPPPPAEEEAAPAAAAA
ncbi:SapC family protein [Aureimonas sp. AU4]|uniref:SapC family protein n=1 Tax=Aureimonas sp. AU4 TaxID=1638163 RepID=UPI000782E9C5|nr:SapC family protein [Aureimonas sp. AU4]